VYNTYVTTNPRNILYGAEMNKPVFINSILTVKASTPEVAKAAEQEAGSNDLTQDDAKRLIAEIFKKNGKSDIQST
jgi:hypothetical protein